MLENLSALAIVPKAKAIAARRLSHGDYLELMRKRSVIEVTAALQSHPYFKDSLKGLSQTNLHRAQIEEALSKDVYYKYESLMRYSFRKGKFGAYFLMRSEINELLAKLRLLSMGFRHHYIIQVPGFLMPKTSFSLLRLAKAESAQDCLEVVAGTPYAKVLAGVLPAAGQKLDYLKCEHAFQSYFYTTVLAQIDRDLSGRSAADTKRLFRMEAEIYNLDLLFRAKAFFSPQLTPEDLKKLLIPVYGVLSAKNMNALADTRGLDEFLKLYNAGRAGQVYGARSADPADASEVSGNARSVPRRAEAAAFFQHAADGACRAVVPGQSGAQQYHQRHRGRALRPFAGADQCLLEILTVSRQPDAAAIPSALGRGSN